MHDTRTLLSRHNAPPRVFFLVPGRQLGRVLLARLLVRRNGHLLRRHVKVLYGLVDRLLLVRIYIEIYIEIHRDIYIEREIYRYIDIEDHLLLVCTGIDR